MNNTAGQRGYQLIELRRQLKIPLKDKKVCATSDEVYFIAVLFIKTRNSTIVFAYSAVGLSFNSFNKSYSHCAISLVFVS